GRPARRGGHLSPAPRRTHLGLLGRGHPGRAGLAAAARLRLRSRAPTCGRARDCGWAGDGGGHGTAADPGPADRMPRPWGTMDRSATPDARASAPPRGETVAIYAVQYTYTDDADRVAIYRPEHREHLAELHREGTLLLSGPLGDGPGALLIVVADSAEDALAALDG